jgi:integrase
MITPPSSKNKHLASKSVSKATNRSKTVYEGESCCIIGDKDYYLNLGLQERQLPRVVKFPNLSEDNVRTGFVEQHQFDRLVKEARGWERLLLELAYTYGWRRTELLSIRVGQADLLTKTIRLDPVQTKNKEAKEITMTDVVFELCKQAVIGKAPTDYLLTRGKKPVRDFRDRWANLTKKANLEGLLVHDLRRSPARQLRKAGIPESTIMDIAGWKTRAMFKRYAITDDSDTRAAVKKLEQARTENSHSFSHNQGLQHKVKPKQSRGRSTKCL